MTIPASAYKQPHDVMLFFEEKDVNYKDNCLAERINYYENLKNDGKVLLSGNFWNRSANFIIVHVSSDAELEQIIDNDPGLLQNTIELVRAMPF